VFEPGKVSRMMREQRVSHSFASPNLLAALVCHPDATADGCPHLRSVFVGGAPITDATARLAHDVFGDALSRGTGRRRPCRCR